MADIQTDFYPQLPATMDGWKKAGSPAVYTAENLSNYIDGGAELYISYNFQNALSLKYVSNANEDITLDIFDMGSSPDAFGVFAHTRETIDSRVGQGCEYAAGLLTFWKDRYYVSILAYPETPEKKETVFKLGRAIAGLIKTEGAPPPIISLLPRENLIAESVHYFHHSIWLNSFYFVANENILNIGNDTPAALGKYRHPAGTFFLLLVQYPDEKRAAAGQEQFLRKFLAGSQVQQQKDGRWAGCQLQGSLFSAVLHAPDVQAVQVLLARVKR